MMTQEERNSIDRFIDDEVLSGRREVWTRWNRYDEELIEEMIALVDVEFDKVFTKEASQAYRPVIRAQVFRSAMHRAVRRGVLVKIEADIRNRSGVAFVSVQEKARRDERDELDRKVEAARREVIDDIADQIEGLLDGRNLSGAGRHGIVQLAREVFRAGEFDYDNLSDSWAWYPAGVRPRRHPEAGEDRARA